MKPLFSHFLLLLYCFGSFLYQDISWWSVVSFLCAVTAATFFYAFQNRTLSAILLCAYGVSIFFAPVLCIFLPLLFFEIQHTRLYPVIPLFALGSFVQLVPQHTAYFFFLVFGSVLALFFQYLTDSYAVLCQQYNQMRDDSTERNLLLKTRNQTLLENQDYAVQNATLQERNRIAREIHDNVGHLLSRCILMTGAVQTINQDENCKDSLQLLQDTLTQAMDAIRSSVHNLHDDSIHLQKNLENLIADFTFCPVQLEYDIKGEMPSAVRYAFLSIAKEALTNIAAHSNATFAAITLREHPAMYQMIIRDNGSTAKAPPSLSEMPAPDSGIGLTNMQDRVRLLHGIFQVSLKNGFQIFISIPIDRLTDS
jgi:signal transduction histidine kinase